jgi:hypothetical protein
MLEPVDNSLKISAFLPEESDGDTFWYTELLHRNKEAGGGNRYRTLRSFVHHKRDDLALQMDTIKRLCDRTGVRAYTRLSPRSAKQVGKAFTTAVVTAAMMEHWDSMHRLYQSALGRTPIHGKRLWLYDIDAPVLTPFQALEEELLARDALVTIFPSRTGWHLIVKPHHITYDLLGITVLKDHPTNLYIPAHERSPLDEPT